MTSEYPTDTRPAPAAAIALAREALEQHDSCFWFRSAEAPLETIAQVQLVIRRLRQYGNRESWDTAYELEQSISENSILESLTTSVDGSIANISHTDWDRFMALTEKALEMGTRNDTGHMIELVTNCEFAPLHSVVWAATAKVDWFNPMSLLEQMRRFSRIEPRAIEEKSVPLTPIELKQRWLHLAEDTEIEITRAAKVGIEPGVVFLAPDGSVRWFDTPGVTIHRATLGGVIPRLGGVHY